MSRRGLTLVEASVAAAIGLVVLAALTHAFAGARRVQDMAGRHLDVLEGTVLAMHQLRLDLRQLSFVPGRPVEGYSLRVAPDGRAVRLRRSVPASDARMGSRFVIVEYRLESNNATPPRFHLRRTVTTASGKPLPGQGEARASDLLRSVTLADLSFRLREDEANDQRVLHVTLVVTSPDGGEPRSEVANVLQIQRPEAPFGATLPLFAEPFPASVQAESPPMEVLAPLAADAGLLPAFL